MDKLNELVLSNFVARLALNVMLRNCFIKQKLDCSFCQNLFLRNLNLRFWEVFAENGIIFLFQTFFNFGEPGNDVFFSDMMPLSF